MYWGQEEVEERLKTDDLLLESYITRRKKKQRENAKIICESRKRLPKYELDKRSELWKKIDAQEQDEALKRMYSLVSELPVIPSNVSCSHINTLG